MSLKEPALLVCSQHLCGALTAKHSSGESHTFLVALVDTFALGGAFYTQNPKTEQSATLFSAGWLWCPRQGFRMQFLKMPLGAEQRGLPLLQAWQVLPGPWFWANDTPGADPSFFLVPHPWRLEGWVLKSF